MTATNQSHDARKIADLESAIECIHQLANSVKPDATNYDLRAILQSISSNAFGALGGGN